MEIEPKWIALELTRRCNLKCVHCRSASKEEVAGHPDFPTEEAFRLIDDIASFSMPVLVLSGGEPLMRSDVFDIAKHGSEKGLRISLATNGTLVAEETCERIKESGIKTVSISLDGSTAKVHDNFRNQKGAFSKIINAARLFKEHDIKFIINSSFTKRNKEGIPGVYKLSKELGAFAWYMFMVVPTGRGKELVSELIEKEDYEDILDWHYRMEKGEDDLLVRPACAPHYYRVVLQKSKEEGARFKRRSLKFSTGRSKGCVAGQVISVIDVDGNVLPCSYFPKPAGNIRERSFQDIWESSGLLKELRDLSTYEGKCGSCEYINVCGGCRARAYSLNENYLQEDPFCNYIPTKRRSLS